MSPLTSDQRAQTRPASARQWIRALAVAVSITALSAPLLAVGSGDVAPSFSLAGPQGRVSLDAIRARGEWTYLDFWASWCGPCQMMAPAYEQAAKMLEPHVRLAKVNTEEEQTLAARFGISSIPTLVLLRGGREVARQPGALGLQDIVRWVRSKL